MKCESAQQVYYDRIFGQSYMQVVKVTAYVM